MARNKRFPAKLTGAAARLFAAGCCHYSDAAEASCDDTPEDLPLFVRLSPQQRIFLVSQVAVGLLCPDEPLPPNTTEHYAAYLGVVRYISTELEIEMDDIYDRDVGEDLIEEYYIKNPPDESQSLMRTKEEMDQLALLEEVSRRRMKKLEKSDSGNNEDFIVPEKELDFGKEIKLFLGLFGGGPCSEDRRSPIRPLTEDEKNYGFRWRLLCDAAFAEHPRMSQINFCWNSYDYIKWAEALTMFFVTVRDIHITREESAIQMGSIEPITYADKTQHARIREVKRVVKQIREPYDSEWDSSRAAEDQRLIFALCDEEVHFGKGHGHFVIEFEKKCVESGFHLSTPNKYQERLEIYRAIKDDLVEGLDKGFNNRFGGFAQPGEYEYSGDVSFQCCNNLSCFKPPKDLKKCGRCKVVCYCSRECQLNDWKEHKKQCGNLATWRKDQDKINELIKKF